MFNSYFTMFLVAVIVILLAKFVLNLNLNKIIGLIINAIVGFIILWLINKTGLVSIPMNIITYIVAGALGIPGVIILILLALIGII